MNQLVLLPVILPLLGAGLSLAFRRSAFAQRVISVTALALVVAVAASLLFHIDRNEPLAVTVGGWPAELGISLVADRLSALLLLTSTIVTLCVLLFSFGQGIIEYGRDTPLSIFHPAFLVLSAGVSNAFLAGDLFNLFVGFEILLVASYVLITLGGTQSRVRAGTIYIVVSLLSSALFLVAVVCAYAAFGTVSIAGLGERIHAVPEAVSLVIQLLLLTTFAIKAAVFPVSAWLPDSYPTAPAPVTAVFAGLLTKVGVYAIIRFQTVVFYDSQLNTILLWAAILTMIIGILGAIAQSDIKRLLSFTLVSHIGYMLFGIGIASRLGLTGAIVYTVHHITVQTTLFLVAGMIETRTGTTNMDLIGGLARAAPILSVLFFVPAMNLAGIPPFSGFLGKVALVKAGVADGSALGMVTVVAAIVTSLLTLYAMVRVWNRVFWRPVEPEPRDIGQPQEPQYVPERRSMVENSALVIERVRVSMALPTAALVLITIMLTVLAGPLFQIADRASVELGERTVYVTQQDQAAGDQP